jgi:hypothetical protein
MTLGEQRRKALATAASQRQSGQRFEQAFHNRCRKSVEPISPIEYQRLLGDRVFGLVDRADAKVATAKNPRKWPNLFDYRAAFVEPPRPGAMMPPVRITLPDGTSVTSEQSDHNQIPCQALHREVTLEATERKQPAGTTSLSEEYWPDMEGLDHRDTVTDFALPEGTFFDIGLVHLLTTTTLDRLRQLYPQGRFEVRRPQTEWPVRPRHLPPSWSIKEKAAKVSSR